MKRIFSVLFALVLALSLGMLPASVVQAANLYEYYNTSDNNSVGYYGTIWYAQTFTAESNHSVTSVKLLLYRVGSPGTVTVSIRDTSGGHPTGSDLTWGTIDGNTLTTSGLGLWYEIALTSYDLTSGTKYAIVVRAPGGSSANYLRWRCVQPAPTYTGGNLELSTNSGTTWTSKTHIDFMFEVWGERPLEVGGEVYPVNKLAILAPWILLVAAIIPVATIVIRRRRARDRYLGGQ